MREAPLPDIIQLVSQGGKSGCFNVVEENKRTKIYLKDGRIIHAVSAAAEGLEAFYEVALWLDGSYSFEEGEVSVAPTIQKPNASILMEMGRRMDEWRVISQKISSVDLYPVSNLLPGETPAGVNPREAKLLELTTGYYTVLELSEVLQKPVLNVAKDLYGLAMAGHIALKGVRSGRKPAVELPAAPAPAPAPAPVPAAAGFPVAEDAPAPPPKVTLDPLMLAKLTAFTQRISQTSKTVLPFEHHEMINRLQGRSTQGIINGEGPEAVKQLALSISKAAVDAGVDAELVKTLNAQLKALFAK
ncbi:MAG: DUF4388 domain-containing protein [Holophagaceae bacterium]|nr:DUF4388 domain-containing protein [Holophagaceae bacterium]